MSVRRDPDRLVHDFLMEGQTELADQVYDAVRATVEQKRQRAVIGSWREPDVNRYLKIGLAVAAVVVVAVVGFRQFGGSSVAGPASSATPAAAATPAAPSSRDSGSTPTLTDTFTSDRNGVAFSHPNGWVGRAATEPWTTGVPDFMSKAGDVVYDPAREGSLWISVASQPIGDVTPDAWAARTIALDDGCGTTEPITIDGASGLIGAGECTRAAVTANGLGHFIWLYTSGDDPSLAATYDRAWFKKLLATVQLQRKGAALTNTFNDGDYGITFSHPSDWVERAATEPWTTSVPDFMSKAGDVVYDPAREGSLWISVASQPIGDATPDEWAARTIALDDGCGTTEPVTIDGASGLIGAGECTRAAVTANGLGYLIWLYTSGDDPTLAATYDRAWFKKLLATVQLQP